MGSLPFDFPVETHSANAAACSGAHFCERHSRSVVAREAQARSASFAEEEVEEEVEVEDDDASPPPEFAAMHAAKARRWASHLPSAAPRCWAVTLERGEKGHILILCRARRRKGRALLLLSRLLFFRFLF